MKRLLLSAFFLVLALEISWADVPETISYQGVLTDNSGAVVADGVYRLTFRLYDSPTTSIVLWSEVHTSVPVANGMFNVILGSINELDIPFDEPYWLGVRIGFDQELLPRIPVTSSAYSLNARSVVDGAITSGKIASGQVVKSINGRTDAVTLAPGTNVDIQESGDTITISATGAGGGWSLTGNAGTNPSTNFLGTTDSKALELRVNSIRALRIEPKSDSPNLIGGYSGNSVWSGVSGASIGGGGESGSVNRVTDIFGTVGGGAGNQAGDNSLSADNAPYTTVSGGLSNTASDNYSTVGGGIENEASEWGATVPGGYLNTADGYTCFAAGSRAKALHDGAFVWSDSRTSADFESEREYQFNVRAYGGARFEDGEGLWVELNWTPIINTSTGARLTNDGIWTNGSDAALKENFATVDKRELLQKLLNMPISTWNHKAQYAGVRHLGPTAQDFYSAFGLGEDDRHIGTTDADGVALAAIQGLYEVIQEKDAKIAELEERLKAVEDLLSSLEQDK
jgi:hypothetical protein